MKKAFGAFCVISVTMAVPSAVLAQSKTIFDGTYIGVSNTATGTGSVCNPINPIPGPLTIQDGKAHFTGGGFFVAFEGDVSAQGDFTMWNVFAYKLTGKIDSSGRASGRINLGDSSCALTAVWQRQ